jgi:hypothetical protein
MEPPRCALKVLCSAAGLGCANSWVYLFIWRRLHKNQDENIARAFKTEQGNPIDPVGLPAYFRRISVARHNAEFNGVFCRSVLNERGKRTQADLPEPITSLVGFEQQY